MTTVMFNTIATVALIKTKQLNNLTLRIFLMICLSDLFLGTVSEPVMLLVYARYYQPLYNCSLHITLEVLLFPTRISAYLVCLTSFDRYARLRYLNRYQVVFTKTYVYRLMCGGGAIMTTTHFALIAVSIVTKVRQIRYIFPISQCLMLVAMIVMYLMTLRAIRLNRRYVSDRRKLEAVDRKVSFFRSVIESV